MVLLLLYRLKSGWLWPLPAALSSARRLSPLSARRGSHCLTWMLPFTGRQSSFPEIEPSRFSLATPISNQIPLPPAFSTTV
jgi:hypothetical protein